MDNTSPKPWAVASNGVSPKVVDAGGKAVCMVTPRAGQWNGDLIAAAPDLLAALDEIFNGTGMTGPNMDAARAAISKAKGD